ncbi:pelota family protein [Candidatus Woesearchaeota archaeon]|nr:pelota family protein [Candidatus Woesearchaeota archaeon]
MHILKQDRKQGFLHVKADTPEDLWLLSRLIKPGDTVRGSTERKLKIGSEDARNQKVVRKKMTLTLQAEKTSYEHETLRILGTITDGPDDVARGEHHSLSIQQGDDLKITKEWMDWQLQKIEDATKQARENIIAVLFDREEATFLRLTNHDHDVLAKTKGDVAKKNEKNTVQSDFWHAINQQLRDYDKRYEPRSIIAASPAFWKDYLKAALDETVAKKTIYATVSDTNEQAINELLKRPELKQALQQDRSAQENHAIAELLHAISAGKAAYGVKEVERKANEGNLKALLVSDDHLMQEREHGNYDHTERIMHAAERGKADIMIVASKEASKQLDGLGGMAGLTRW